MSPSVCTALPGVGWGQIAVRLGPCLGGAPLCRAQCRAVGRPHPQRERGAPGRRTGRRLVRKRVPGLEANVVTRPQVVPTGLQCPLWTPGVYFEAQERDASICRVNVCVVVCE